MLRFYKNMVDQLLCSLLYLRDKISESGEEITPEKIREYCLNNWYRGSDSSSPSRKIRGAVYNFINADEDSSYNINVNKLIEEIADQLNSTNPNEDATIIDSIVRILRLPLSDNILAGRTLDQLRKAILLPEEVRGLTDRLNDIELSCASCGAKLIQGEMVVLRKKYTAKNNCIMCLRCSTPTTVGCKQIHNDTVYNGTVCEGHAHLSKRFITSLRKLQKCERDETLLEASAVTTGVIPVALDIESEYPAESDGNDHNYEPTFYEELDDRDDDEGLVR
jgi:hypothetical protein